MDDEVRIIHGDCLEVLPTLDRARIAAVVTDPPYGMGYRRRGNSRRSISSTGKVQTDPVVGDDKPFDPAPWLGFPAVAFTGAQWFYDRLPAGGSLHCWDKRGDYEPIDQADCDLVWISRRAPGRVFRLVWRGLCRHAEQNAPIEHPTQKPVRLMSWIIGLLKLPEGSLVLDPYAGSGTTAVACLKAGLRCIAIEKDARYLPIIRRRVDEARTPLLDALEPPRAAPR